MKKTPWLTIGRPLSSGRQVLLTVFSFLSPLLLWCAVSYLPFFWHPDVKLDIGGVFDSTVYVSGDHVGKDYFPELEAQIKEANGAVLAARASGSNEEFSKRANLKIIRQISSIAVRNEVLDEDGMDDDAAIYAAWGRIAEKPDILKKRPLTAENVNVVQSNWKILSSFSPTYEKKNFPQEPLLQLLPQGKRANPVYLPAPHEVVETGLRDWRSEPEEGRPSMFDRYSGSLRTVFFGFLLAACVAVPLGVLGGTYDFFGKLLEPFWDFFRYMPAPAFGTLLVAVLGAHQAPKVALVFIGTFPHLLLMLTKTVRMVEHPLLEAAQTLGSKGRGLLGRVVVPSSLPNIYNDLRIALGWAWTWLVIAELIGVKTGLTEVIDTQGVRRNFDRVFPVIILIGITGFVTDQVLEWLRPRLFPWMGGKPDSFLDRIIARISRFFKPSRMTKASNLQG